MTETTIYKNTTKERSVLKWKAEATLAGISYVRPSRKNYSIYKFEECKHEAEFQMSQVRSNSKFGKKFICQTCLMQKNYKIAEEAGVEFFCKLSTGHLKFKRKDCGHTFVSSYANLVNIGSCKECTVNRLHNEASDAGLEIVEKTSKFSKYVYKLPCGHSKEISPWKVRNGIFECKECFEESIRDKLHKDYDYIGEADNNESGVSKRKVKDKRCGHTFDVSLELIHEGLINYECPECRIEAIKKEAADIRMEWLGANKSKSGYHRYKALCCNNVFDLQRNQVKLKSFTCYNCNESYLSKPNFIYLFEMRSNDFRWLKLGYSRNPMQRVKDYGLADGVSVVLLKSVQFQTGLDGLRSEKELHMRFKDMKLNAKDMRVYLTESGSTECYPIEMEDVLIEEMSKLELT